MADTCYRDLEEVISGLFSNFKKEVVSEFDPKYHSLIASHIDKQKDEVSAVLLSAEKGEIDFPDDFADIADFLEHVSRQKLAGGLSTIKTAHRQIKVFEGLVDNHLGKNGYDEAGVRGVLDNFFGRIENSMEGGRRQMSQILAEELLSSGRAGHALSANQTKELVNLVNDSVGGGDKLINVLGGGDIGNFRLFKALKKGEFDANSTGSADIVVLNTLANVFKKYDDRVISTVQSAAPVVSKKGHVVPARVSSARFNRWKKEAFKGEEKQTKNQTISWLKERIHTPERLSRLLKEGKITEKNFIEREQNYFSSLYDKFSSDSKIKAGSNFRVPKRILNVRTLAFKNDASEFEMYKLFNDKNKDVLGAAISHRENMAAQGKLFESLGGDADLTLSMLSTHLSSKGIFKQTRPTNASKSLEKVDFSTNAPAEIHSRTDFMKTAETSLTEGELVLSNIANATSSFVSAALTGMSSLRNILLDNTLFSGAIKDAYFNGGVLRGTWNSLKGMAGAVTNSKETKALIEFGEKQGAILKINVVNQIKGVADTGLSKTASKTAGLGDKLANLTDSLTLASKLQNGSRAEAYASVSYEVIKRKNSEIDALEPQLVEVFKANGIGRNEWDLLRKMKTTAVTEKGIFFDPKELSKLDGSAIKKKFETSEEAVDRMWSDYNQSLQEFTDTISPRVRHRDRIIRENTKGLTSILVGIPTKFMSILNSTFKSGNKAMRIKAGLNADKDGYRGLLDVITKNAGDVVDYKNWKRGGLNGPIFAAKFISTLYAGGTLINWANDIKNNRTPKPASPKQAMDAINQTGMLGPFLSWIYSSLNYGVTTPVEGTIKPYADLIKKVAKGDFEGVPRNLRRSSAKTPVLNTPYFQLAINSFTDSVLEENRSSFEKKLMFEANQDFIFGGDTQKFELYKKRRAIIDLKEKIRQGK